MDFSHAQIDVAIGSGAATAGTDAVTGTVWQYPETGNLVSLRLTPDRDVTADDTNYVDISVEIDGTEVASEQTTTGDTGDLTGGTDIALALTASGVSLEMQQNSTIVVKATKAGTGVAVGGIVSALVRFDRQGS